MFVMRMAYTANERSGFDNIFPGNVLVVFLNENLGLG